MSFKMKSLDEVMKEVKDRGVVPLPEDESSTMEFEEFLRKRTSEHYKKEKC